MRTRFEWDDQKARANLKKHGVSFDMATFAFSDPLALMTQDRIENGEYRWQTEKRSAVMNKNIVRYEVDLSNPPPLTDQQKAELAALALRQKIDYSDIPPLSDDVLKNAIPRRHYTAAKTPVAA